MSLMAEAEAEAAAPAADTPPATPPAGDPPATPPAATAPAAAGDPPPAAGAQAPPPPVYDPAEFGKADEKTGRPEQIPEKYWDEKTKTVRWAAVLKQHNWLQSKVGEKREAPPEKYTLEGEAATEVPAEIASDPVFKQIADYSKTELGLSNSQFSQMVRLYWAAAEKSGQEAREAEIATLGENALQEIEQLKAGLAATLSPPEYEEAVAGATSAAALATYRRLLNKALPTPMERDGAVVDSGDSEETLYAVQTAVDEYGQPKMANKAYAAAYRARLAKFLASKKR